MTTIDWLAERIGEGESLLERLYDLSGGPAQRSGEVARSELADIRAFLSAFSKWDSENATWLSKTFRGEPAWIERYRSVEQVDRQLVITDFASVKGRLESTILSKLVELRSISDSAVRRISPRRRGRGKVLLGHGRSSAWRELEAYLEQSLQIGQQEFERESVTDASIHACIEALLERCSFAVLVMTGEDVRAEGTVHARENFIHEVGLLQGRLGPARVLVLLEEGCEEFSNIRGLVQLRFPKGRLEATFEDVRHALAREGLTAHRAKAS